MDVISLGEAVVEILRKQIDQPFDEPGDFLGPFPSGAPAILVHTLANLNIRCGFIAPVGNDGFGKCVVNTLRKSGVDVSRIVELQEYTTGIAFTRFCSDGSRRFIYHFRHAAPGQFSPNHLDAEYLSQTKFLHISGNVLAISESAKKACYRAVEIVKKSGGRISFDPNFRPELVNPQIAKKLCEPLIKSAYLLLPSGKEVEMLAGIRGFRRASHRLLKQGAKIIAYKDGKRGSWVFTKDQEFHVLPFEVDEMDPTGAGDCYNAGFLYGLLKRWHLRRTAEFANAAGAFSVTKQGGMGAMATLDTLVNFIGEKRKFRSEKGNKDS